MDWDHSREREFPVSGLDAFVNLDVLYILLISLRLHYVERKCQMTLFPSNRENDEISQGHLVWSFVCYSAMAKSKSEEQTHTHTY